MILTVLISLLIQCVFDSLGFSRYVILLPSRGIILRLLLIFILLHYEVYRILFVCILLQLLASELLCSLKMVSEWMDSSPFSSGYELYKRTNTLAKR